MQVTHTDDNITHAVIGGGVSTNFGISESAEFFHILSSTLYRDQKRAVVRETLCNAWDAHIASGITDKPIKVTLSRESLTIQDFGTGISKEMMGPIYGVYGASTKKNDGQQTGGFGLGCKSPFAYTDHFQVTSSHKGERTIYSMTKSSAESNGRPGITAIASFPSQESGIIVSVNIKSYDDVSEFSRLIKEIAFSGEMLVEFNGTILPVMPLSTAPHGYIITANTFSTLDSSYIWIRYGNVVYPVPSHDEYEEAFRSVHRTVRSFTTGNRWDNSNYRIVFMAPPNSIAVTPSRESLSMQEHTIRTIKNILSSTNIVASNDFMEETSLILREQVDKAIAAKELDDVIQNKLSIPVSYSLDKKDSEFISDEKSAARHLIARGYPGGPEIANKDILYRLHRLKQIQFEPRGLVQSLHSILNRFKNRGHRRSYNIAVENWFGQNVTKKLYKDTLNHPVIDFNCFRVYDGNKSYGRSWDSAAHFYPLDKYSCDSPIEYMRLLRNFMVIAHKVDDLQRLQNAPHYTEFGMGGQYIVYFCPPNSKDIEAVREFFVGRGYRLFDLTKRNDWEPEVIEVPEEPKKPVVPRLKGLPILTGSLIDKDEAVDFNQLDRTSPRTETPEFVVLYKPSQSGLTIGGMNKETSYAVIKLFGDKGALTNNVAQHDRYVGKGALDVYNYITPKVTSYVNTSKEIRNHIAYNRKVAMDKLEDYQHQAALSVILDSTTLSNHYNISADVLNDTDALYFRIWSYLKDRVDYESDFLKKGCSITIPDLIADLDKINLEPNLDSLVKKISTCTNLRYINLHRVREDMNPLKPSSVANAAIEFFKNAL